MGLFGFLKKGGNVPPDVGHEELPEGVTEVEDVYTEDDDEELSVKKSKKKGKKEKIKESSNIEAVKAVAKIESLQALVKGYGERISLMSEQIGELRAMSLSNEKAVGRVKADSAKAIDIVEEVKPHKLRSEYQKMEIRIEELSERLGSNKEFMNTVMNEMKDIRGNMSTFMSTNELLKLNDDIKKDLLSAQKLSSKSKTQADKIEQIFVEIRRGISESSKLNSKVNFFESEQEKMRKELEKIKIDFSEIVEQKEFLDFKKEVDNKVLFLKNFDTDLKKLQNENERLGRIIEKTLALTKENSDDIGKINLDYDETNHDERISSILKIIDTLAGQIAELKGKVSKTKIEKIKVKPEKKSHFGKRKLHLKHIKVHPKILKHFKKKKKKHYKKSK